MSESDEQPVGQELEARVTALLRQLADDPPTGPPVQDAVLVTLRWQSAVRGAAVFVRELAAGAVDAVSQLLGVRAPRGGGRQ